MQDKSRKPTKPGGSTSGRHKSLGKATAKARRPRVGHDQEGRFTFGNRIWECRSSHGRKPIFKSPEQLWEACVEYFHWVEQNPLKEEKIFHASGLITKDHVFKMRPMTQAGLCVFLDITAETWNQYRRKTDFSEIVGRVDAVMFEQKFSGASAELMNPNIIARELGLSERQEVTGEGGGPIRFTDTERAARLATLIAKAKDRKK